ncbi:hypothetical protein Smar_1064 [Staphylothermus marinus F1]|uniref:Uncharacterized protein n=1 Tax=Staphylothermus marinus (strain ATCC 43588 / DSM 3639 / JCM 9404 / F1) TaxID=399550 RepID=A3DNF2_STAMF|nr:hypothetical protein [Staphylothermus marinus]ABN70162.1 hypothetical protein Smar_1064 [Staphylothermus marinus F1]
MNKPIMQLKIYICKYVEKEKTLASRHMIASIGICKLLGEKELDLENLPEENRKALRLRGETNLFDPILIKKLFDLNISPEYYIKLKI